jgi:hypothetical protein
MSDQTEVYVKTNAAGETVERPVHTAQDRVAAKFAGFRPKDKKAATSAKSADTKADAKAADAK